MILEDIMKFEKLNLIDIEKDGDQYVYLYAIFAIGKVKGYTEHLKSVHNFKCTTLFP
jgi:hypothetical protein